MISLQVAPPAPVEPGIVSLLGAPMIGTGYLLIIAALAVIVAKYLLVRVPALFVKRKGAQITFWIGAVLLVAGGSVAVVTTTNDLENLDTQALEVSAWLDETYGVDISKERAERLIKGESFVTEIGGHHGAVKLMETTDGLWELVSSDGISFDGHGASHSH